MPEKISVNGEGVVQEQEQEVIQVTAEKVQEEVQEVQQQEQPVEESKEDVKEETSAPEDLLLKEQEEESEKKTEEQSKQEMLEKLQKYAFKDELTDEDLKEIEELGIDPQVAMLAIEGLKAEVTKTVNRLYDVVGGKEQWEQIATWANENLDSAEREEFNNLMKSNDPVMMKWALKGLKAVYLEANQNEAVTLHGTSPESTPAVKPYKSYREFVDDLKKPEYKKDPKFRELVDKRLAISKF